MTEEEAILLEGARRDALIEALEYDDFFEDQGPRMTLFERLLDVIRGLFGRQ